MLQQLSITNYVIIEEITIEFNNGFTAITGETGAGKSILLGALSLILGQRANTSVLKNINKKCIVEGEFELNKEKFSSFFDENELDFENPNIIRREINAKGKSRAFVNDTPVNLSTLKALSAQLIDIHSQHSTLRIQESNFQMEVIDAFTNNGEKLLLYKNQYHNYLETKKELEQVKKLSTTAKLDEDYIAYQVKEIEDLNLKSNEKEKIEAELLLINNSEEIKRALDSSSNILNSSNKSLLAELKNVTNLFSKINNCSNKYHSIYNRLTSLTIELEDIANEVEIENDDLSFSPENLAHLNNRLSSIFSIEQKHNVSSTHEILELFKQLNIKIENTQSFDKRILELIHKVEQQKSDLISIAEKIALVRKGGFKKMCSKITQDLVLLGMEEAVFELKHETVELNETGIDAISFTFSANKGVLPIELRKAASGGELSRLMLVIKSILAKKKLSAIVFDEIDTGVSGDIADKMATIMNNMAKNMQVIAITHLPQVAAKAKHHFKIYKDTTKENTVTHLCVLNQADRVEELAKMLSGEKLSKEAIGNAKSLLNI